MHPLLKMAEWWKSDAVNAAPAISAPAGIAARQQYKEYMRSRPAGTSCKRDILGSAGQAGSRQKRSPTAAITACTATSSATTPLQPACTHTPPGSSPPSAPPM